MNTKTKPKAKKKGLTPRQKKLAMLMMKVGSGDMTMEQALLDAGFSEKTARQQTATVNRVRRNSAMQEALRKAGFTEELISQKVMEGLAATKGVVKNEDDEDGETVASADYMARHKYLETGAKLLDAFPATKNINADVGIEELLDTAEKERVVAPWEEEK